MADIMTKKIFLEVCMGIEALCAELYYYYSEIYKEIPDASSLWKKTALEEENHQRQFELVLRLFDDIEFGLLDGSLTQAYVIQAKLLNLMDIVKTDKPDLLLAVSKAIEMEEKLADLHVQTALKFGDESMQNLFKALSEADRGHVSELQHYRAILYLPQSEMEGY